MSSYKEFRKFLRNEGCEAAFGRAFYNHNGFTYLDEALWEIADAECIFGHANVATTAIYVDVINDEKREVANRISLR